MSNSILRLSRFATILTVALSPTATAQNLSQLYGKIQVVDSFADFTIRYVESFPGVDCD
ncbi:MAG: hypothetical protein AB8B86_05120 [Pseudomonadales bacterium]